MLVENEHGEGVRTDAPADPLILLIAGASDGQIRGILARILRAAALPSGRAAKILGVGRTTYFEALAMPLPAGLAGEDRSGPED